MSIPPSAKRTAIWIAAFAALGAVFFAYLQPTLVVDLANRVWSCI